MAGRKSKDLFKIPEQRKRTGLDRALTVQSAAAWADSLPLANVGQTARQLFERLERLNHLVIPPGERYAILETLGPALELVLQSLMRRCLSHNLPLSGRTELVAKLTRELMAKAVVGYKIAEEQTAEGWPVVRLWRRRRRGQALHRKLHYLSRLLLQDFQLYRRHRTGLWDEIHKTYLRARDVAVAQLPYENVDTRFASHSAIEDLYKQCLLLGLSGPYGLLQGDIGRVFNGLFLWAPLCSLGSQPDEPSLAQWFLVDPESDAPPEYVQKDAATRLRGWMLDAEPLLDLLAQRIDELQHSARLPGGRRPREEPIPFSTDLLSRLLLAWGQQRNRERPRTPSPGEVRLAYGMGSLMALLDAPHALGEALPSAAALHREDRVDGDSQFQLGDWAIDLDSANVENIALGSTDDSAASWARISEDTLARIHTCSIVDRSSRGFHIRADGNDDVNRRVGELVAVCDLAADGSNGPWRVGAVRWMHLLSSRDVRCGIQVLADHAEPVVLRWSRPRSHEDEDLPALLLKGRGEEPDTLVTRTFFASPRDRLALVRQGTVNPILFDQALARSQSYVQFAFSSLGEPRAAQPGQEPGRNGDKRNAGTEDQFDGLWGSL